VEGEEGIVWMGYEREKKRNGRLNWHLMLPSGSGDTFVCCGYQKCSATLDFRRSLFWRSFCRTLRRIGWWIFGRSILAVTDGLARSRFLGCSCPGLAEYFRYELYDNDSDVRRRILDT